LPFHAVSHTLADPMKERIRFHRGRWFHAPKTHPALRGWRKLRLGVDDTGIIVAVELTDNTMDSDKPT